MTESRARAFAASGSNAGTLGDRCENPKGDRRPSPGGDAAAAMLCLGNANGFRNRGHCTMAKRVYLAGPEVFLANAREIGARKRAICEQHGLVGVFPSDEEEACDPALPLAEQGLAISRAMERVMWGCNAMIVNLTPFRGPSADVGSAYEMGFMRALGRSIFAYTNDARPFLDRVAGFCGGAVRVRPTGGHEDPDGMAIEPFELQDNLMLAGGVIASGGCIIAETIPHAERYTSLAAFERCVALAASELLRQAASTQG
jgi:nucleoside 2-deoxyribosyltransferase